jgi:hypothetical protein
MHGWMGTSRIIVCEALSCALVWLVFGCVSVVSECCPPLPPTRGGGVGVHARARPYTQYSGLCVPPFVVVYTFRRRRVQFNYAGGGRVHTHEHTTIYKHTIHTHTHEQPRMHSKGNIETLTMAPPLCGVCKCVCIYIYTHIHIHHIIIIISRPQVERQYPPNLSILISGGKETNRDSLSSGERSGRSPSSESGRAPSPCPELWSHGKASLSAVAGRAKVPWKRAPGRVTAPSIGPASRPSRLRCCTCPRVGLFGNAALSGW